MSNLLKGMIIVGAIASVATATVTVAGAVAARRAMSRSGN